MLTVSVIEPVFVKTIPRELALGKLYVSMEYGTVVHVCCCGCGNEVVTPLTPTDWRIEYDGERLTLRPSVGSWTLPCRSHYVIRANKVIECDDWDEERIEAERARDAAAKRAHYADPNRPTATKPPLPRCANASRPETPSQDVGQRPRHKGWVIALLAFFRR